MITKIKEKILNEPLNILLQKISVVNLFLIFLAMLGFGFTIYFLISQIYLLSLELKSLGVLIETLRENQAELKNQLLLKDQQITLLKNSIQTLDLSATKSPINESYAFESLKQEILKNNSQISFFSFQTGIIICGVIGICACAKFFL